MPLPVCKKKNSCIAKPLYDGDENEFTSSKILFPSLHVHLGIINSLVDELEKVWPETVLWFLWLGLTRQEFHGKHFNVRIEKYINAGIYTQVRKNHRGINEYIEQIVTQGYNIVAFPIHISTRGYVSHFSTCVHGPIAFYSVLSLSKNGRYGMIKKTI